MKGPHSPPFIPITPTTSDTRHTGVPLIGDANQVIVLGQGNKKPSRVYPVESPHMGRGVICRGVIIHHSPNGCHIVPHPIPPTHGPPLSRPLPSPYPMGRSISSPLESSGARGPPSFDGRAPGHAKGRHLPPFPPHPPWSIVPNPIPPILTYPFSSPTIPEPNGEDHVIPT